MFSYLLPQNDDTEETEDGTPGPLKLYTWELSYFSGKARGYLRHKARLCPAGQLTFEEVNATPEVCEEVLTKSTRSATGRGGSTGLITRN